MRQYIGARYVPKFMGTYDATQIYEALCVVDNGMGTSYIAKVPTPANTPLTDTTYWAIYGASSGAIINLQDQIDDINNVKIPDINSDISALETKVDNLDERFYLFVGDSYVANFNPNWATKVVDYLGLDSDHYETVSVGGAGFRDRNETNSFLNLVTNYSGAIDRDKITDIVVAGGLNDSRFTSNNADANALATNIAAFFTYCRTEFANAKIWVGYISGELDYIANDISLKARQWCLWQYIRCTALNGGYYLFNSELAIHLDKSCYNADGIHPSNTGATYIGNAIANNLKYCPNDCIYPPLQLSLTAGSGFALGNAYLEVKIFNNKAHVYATNYISMPVTQNETITNTFKTILTMGNFVVNKATYLPLQLQLYGFDSATFQNVPAVLAVANNEIQLKTFDTSGSSFATHTATAANAQITIMLPIEFDFDTLDVN